ncbi:MAG TPA: surface carbohydrate biosynthesis protein [Anaerolineales bacterium]|nr:surface carbohydrate biosynthesis protein [Anaerolineales bacterium]
MQVPKQKLKWLIFPIENYVREFYGKSLLSAVAAERGWGALLAYKGYIRHNLPAINGVIVEMNMTNAERVERYLDLGWRVCAWDEEGLIYNNGEVYAQRRLNEAALGKIEKVFLWGENQRKDILEHSKGIEHKLFLTGNPRFDLLRPDLRGFYAPAADSLKNSYGRYILVNTTFGDVNHYFGRDYNMQILREAGKLTTEAQVADQIAREAYKVSLFNAFIGMLPGLSAHFPEHTIIVRPHPAEDFDSWSSAARGLPNVSMIHAGDPIPWMLGAEVVIHNSCTTGVQAYLLGRPVIAYRPVQSEKYDMVLPNALSFQAQDLDGLVAMIGQFTAHPGRPDAGPDEQKRLIMQKYIESMQGAWASDRIMDELEKLAVSPQTLAPGAFPAEQKEAPRPAGMRDKLAGLLAGMKKRLAGDAPKPPDPHGKNWDNYTRQRFPALDYDIQSDLKRMQTLTGRFSNVRVERADNDLVCFYPSED